MAAGRDNAAAMSAGHRVRRVLLVGWDGAEPHALRSLLASGRLPHLKSLVDSGVVLDLEVPRPSIPEAAWTSLATGKRPHEHGVLHACHKAREGWTLQPVTRHDRKCSALWNVLGRAGLNSCIVGWPITHPAESFPGVCVSDFFAASHPITMGSVPVGSSVSPPEAARTFIERSMSPHQVEEVTLSQLLPPRVIGSRAYADVEAACRGILAQTATLFRSIRWCLNTGRWDFAACVFPGIRRSHDLVSRSRGLVPAVAELGNPIIVGCYEHHDLLLGQLLSQVDDDTYVLVVSLTSNSLTVTSQGDCADFITAAASARNSGGLAVICGPDVCRQSAICPRSLLDITPTLLALLGVSHGEDMGGRPLADLFAGGLDSKAIETWDPPAPNSATPITVESTAPALPTVEEARRNSETQHLDELGYVDPLDVAAQEAAQNCERMTELNRAISLLDAGLVAQAANALERLTEQYPKWHVCWSLLAETYFRAGQFDAARKQIDRLTSHGFESPHLYLLSAAVAIAQRQYDRALEQANCARRGSASPPGFSLLMGNIHLRKHNLPEAESAFRQAIKSDGPSAQALDGVASVKLHSQEYEEAAVLALDALERDMRLAKAHYHLGVALYFLNKPHEALQALESWATIDSHAAAPYRWMARVHATLLRDTQQAQACLELGKQAIRRHRSPETAREAGTSAPTPGL